MKFEEAEPNSSAFGGFPFDLSAVCLNVTKKPQWHPVSKFMAPAPGPSDRENRALIPSSPPAVGKRTRPNWPPSIRREEANVLSSLKKRLGYYKVRNTSTFKTILTKEDREDENLVGEENEMTVRGSSEQTPGDAAHKTDLLKQKGEHVGFSSEETEVEKARFTYKKESLRFCLCCRVNCRGPRAWQSRREKV
ncbi:hypothetical protein RUM44_012555 [Polyplax serrata]|uniref:Uncharacterized protein n=1 Tax=Polyplax serrata TaxID=468196 RepID=A0ABR1BFV3_POLSC